MVQKTGSILPPYATLILGWVKQTIQHPLTKIF